MANKWANKWVVLSLLGVALLGFVAGGYFYYRLYKKLTAANILTLKLQEELSKIKLEKNGLLAKLQDEQSRNDSIVSQISGMVTTVGNLQKLSQTDEELLKKYSKVYFLNEHYVPSKLTVIPDSYLYNSNRSDPIRVLPNVWPYLDRMMKDAEQNKVDLKIVSAYRGFGTQSNLKSQYIIKYGNGANQFSADQGYSEHQLGTALDFGSTSAGLNNFDKASSYTWLLNNAYKYGFVLSYPKDNKYYIFEPWHWRFVGVELATKIHNENKYFYDLDQREIDQFLIRLFD